MNNHAPCLDDTPWETRNPACRLGRTAAFPCAGQRRLRRSRRSPLLEQRTREVLKLAGDSLVFLALLGSAMGTMWGLSLL